MNRGSSEMIRAYVLVTASAGRAQHVADALRGSDGIVLVDAPASQRPTLERLAAEQAGMTLPPPVRIKRRTDRRFRPYAAAA